MLCYFPKCLMPNEKFELENIFGLYRDCMAILRKFRGGAKVMTLKIEG